MANWKSRSFREEFDNVSEHMELYPSLYDEEGIPIDFDKDDEIVSTPSYPEIKSKWRHTNGIKYKVLYITNLESQNIKYEPQVVYKGKNGNVWSRPLSDWSRSFTEIKK